MAQTEGNIAMTPLRFGVIGAGVIAPTHAKALSDLEDAQLVAIADIDEEKASKLAETYGVRAYVDVTELLRRDDIDVVNVCVPSGLHAELGIRAAEAGKHVIVEKPIDVNLRNADRLIAACHKAGVTIAVISQFRFGPGAQFLRQALDSGRFGKVTMGEAACKYFRTQAYYDSGTWRATWELDGGGALMNQGVHMVDTFQWLMGDVESLMSYTATLTHKIVVEDCAAAVLQFKSGAIGLLQSSTSHFPGLFQRVEIHGDEGSAAIEDTKITYARFKDELGEVGSYGAGRARAETASTSQPGGAAANPAALQVGLHGAEILDVITAIREHRTPLITGEEARKPLEIILAVYESAKTGKRVTFPFSG